MKTKFTFDFVSKILLLAISVFLLSFIAIPIYENGNVISLFSSGNLLLIFYYVIIELVIITNIVFLLFNFKFDSKNLNVLLFIITGFLLIVSKDLNNTFLENYNEFNSFGFIFVILSFVSAFTSMLRSYNQNQYSIYDIVETAMLVAFAIALDLPGLKIRIGASGGSISFTMIPLLILALRQGFSKGFLSIGIVYGFITCLVDGWGLYTFPFDYLLGYGSLAILGLFKNYLLDNNDKSIVKRYIVLCSFVVVSVIARLMFATLSGVILYETEFVASLTYNMSYILPSGAVAVVALALLYKPLLKINSLFINKYQR